jgi:phage repressor protein C with HTH and peptisase S24 domain
MNTNLSSKKVVKSEIGVRIKHARGKDTQREFAKILGFSASYLSETESGKTKPSLELLVRISLITNYSLHWLLTGEGPMLLEPSEFMVKEHSASYGERGTFTLVPQVALEGVMGTAGKGIEGGAKGKYAFRHTWLQSKGNFEDFILFEVRGDSMDPTITDGDVVLIDRSKKQVVVGNVYALRTENAVMVKRLQPMDANRIKAMSDNKLYESYEIDLGKGDIEIIGQVIWVGRELVK